MGRRNLDVVLAEAEEADLARNWELAAENFFRLAGRAASYYDFRQALEYQTRVVKLCREYNASIEYIRYNENFQQKLKRRVEWVDFQTQASKCEDRGDWAGAASFWEKVLAQADVHNLTTDEKEHFELLKRNAEMNHAEVRGPAVIAIPPLSMVRSYQRITELNAHT
jgi:hypothetical protein